MSNRNSNNAASVAIAMFFMAVAMCGLYVVYDRAEHRDAYNVIENHGASAAVCKAQKCTTLVLYLERRDDLDSNIIQKSVVKFTYDEEFTKLRRSEQLYIQDYWSDKYHTVAGWKTVHAEMREL